MTLLSPIGYVWRRSKEGLLFLRGKRILRRYTAHYRHAQRVYRRHAPAFDGITRSIGDVGVLVLRPDAADNVLKLPSDYAAIVARVAKSADAALERSANCHFVPAVTSMPVAERTVDIAEVASGGVIAIELLEPFAIDGLHELCELLLDRIEPSFFASHTIADKVYVYRSPISHQVPRTSWRWHFDNHPREMLKLMVYLTDVTEGTAPFEYLRERSSSRALSGSPIAPLFGNSRVAPEEIDRRVRSGWAVEAITGPRGTVIVFDDNIVHRATLAKRAHRDVVVFQIRPAVFKASPRIDPRWTGTFGHRAMNGNPDDLVQHRS